MRKLRLATCQYPIEHIESWDGFADKIAALVGDAVGRGARLLLLPEYASMELVSLFDEDVRQSLPAQMDALQGLAEPFLAITKDLATAHGVYLQPGTFPIRLHDGRFCNRAYFISPDGHVEHQDKIQMTRFEDEVWGISSSDEIKTFDTSFGRVGINICYDCEFPLIARQQVEAGAQLILVPSCTDTLAGFNRVRIGCAARAMENQCFVVQSSTVGIAPWSLAVDVNVGEAAVFTPVDTGFPDDGVLARGRMGQPQWVYADLDFTQIEKVRENGEVRNHWDWSKLAGRKSITTATAKRLPQASG